MYGHEVVLPIEINLYSIQLQRQNEIPIQDYLNMMYGELNLLDEERLNYLENIIH